MGDLLFGILILVAFAFFAGTLGVVSWRTERYLSDREGAAHRMDPCSIRNLDRLFKPSSVALIGATPRHGTVGELILRNLREAHFPGPLMLVNPRHRRD